MTNDADRPSTPRPSISHAEKAAVRRRPRYVLGTFWAICALIGLITGIASLNGLIILIAIGLGAYSVYLYRGGRYGFFFI